MSSPNGTQTYSPFRSSNDALDATTSSRMATEDLQKIITAIAQLNTK